MMPVVTSPPPPLTGNAGSVKAKPSPKQTGTTKRRTDGINGIWQLAGFGCMLTGQLADAGAISKFGSGITDELVKLGENDEKIGNILDQLGNMGPYGALITAVTPLAIQVLINHNRMKALPAMAQLGVTPRATLEAEVRTAMATQEAEAMRLQREAEERLDVLKREMAAHADAMTGHANASANGQA